MTLIKVTLLFIVLFLESRVMSLALTFYFFMLFFKTQKDLLFKTCVTFSFFDQIDFLEFDSNKYKAVSPKIIVFHFDRYFFMMLTPSVLYV